MCHHGPSCPPPHQLQGREGSGACKTQVPILPQPLTSWVTCSKSPSRSKLRDYNNSPFLPHQPPGGGCMGTRRVKEKVLETKPPFFTPGSTSSVCRSGLPLSGAGRPRSPPSGQVTAVPHRELPGPGAQGLSPSEPAGPRGCPVRARSPAQREARGLQAQEAMALWAERLAEAPAARETSREGARGDEKDGGRTLMGGGWTRPGAGRREPRLGGRQPLAYGPAEGRGRPGVQPTTASGVREGRCWPAALSAGGVRGAAG